MRDIGKNIRLLRTRQNMTQDELAEKLFVTRQTVSNYETGRSRPDVEMLARIAEVLKTDANTVIYGPAPAPEKAPVRKLMAGSAVVILLVLVRDIMLPYANVFRAQFFSIAPVMLINSLLDPLIWLVSGWTLTFLLTMALKKGPLKHRCIPYVRRVLVLILVLWLTASLCFIIPFALDDYLYCAKLRGAWVEEPYESNGEILIGKRWEHIPFPFLKWMEPIGIPLVQFNFLYPWSPAILSSALCLCGFPQKRSKSTSPA